MQKKKIRRSQGAELRTGAATDTAAVVVIHSTTGWWPSDGLHVYRPCSKASFNFPH